jgi:hypothetical protein
MWMPPESKASSSLNTGYISGPAYRAWLAELPSGASWWAAAALITVPTANTKIEDFYGFQNPGRCKASINRNE